MGVKTRVVLFPFDLFGSGGAGAGAELLGDELREMLADNRRETVASRARAYTEHIRLREFSFDTLDKLQDWREQGRRAVRQALREGEFLVWITGNHLGALPVYDELSGSEDSLVLQLDAHLDIHHFADCTAELSHGNFLLHCAGPLPPLVNIGHRELLLTPEYIAEHYQAAHPAADLVLDAARVLKEVGRHSQSAKRAFLDLDCDVFDPAFFPAVSRPVPFGMSSQQVLAVIEAAWSERMAGVILSEFDPGRDDNDRCLSTLAWLLEYLLLRLHEG